MFLRAVCTVLEFCAVVRLPDGYLHIYEGIKSYMMSTGKTNTSYLDSRKNNTAISDLVQLVGIASTLYILF